MCYSFKPSIFICYSFLVSHQYYHVTVCRTPTIANKDLNEGIMKFDPHNHKSWYSSGTVQAMYCEHRGWGAVCTFVEENVNVRNAIEYEGSLFVLSPLVWLFLSILSAVHSGIMCDGAQGVSKMAYFHCPFPTNRVHPRCYTYIAHSLHTGCIRDILLPLLIPQIRWIQDA